MSEQRFFKSDDLLLVISMLNYLSMTQIQREFGYNGGGNSAIKAFLLSNGIDPMEYVVSRHYFMKRKMRHKENQEKENALNTYNTYTDESGRTIKKYPPGYAYGARPQTISESFCLDLTF